MDIKQYAKEVLEKLESLSDEEFDKLLIEAGINKEGYHCGLCGKWINDLSYNGDEWGICDNCKV